MYLQQFALYGAKLCAQFIRLSRGEQKLVSFLSNPPARGYLQVASCKSCMRQVADNAQAKGGRREDGEFSPTSCKFAAVLTYDIQAECHRNLWLRIHLALVDAAVTWLRIFHMQRPILGVGGAYDLQAKCIDKSLRLKLS